MRKSKLANICLYTSLGVILLNILAVIILFTKKQPDFINVMSWLYRPVMIVFIVILIVSIISLVQILISKGQLKGLAKSIIALILSVIGFISTLIQGVFIEAIISVDKIFIH